MHHKLNSCRDHWICVLIYPRDGKVLVLDSADYATETYEPFMKLVER